MLAGRKVAGQTTRSVADRRTAANQTATAETHSSAGGAARSVGQPVRDPRRTADLPGDIVGDAGAPLACRRGSTVGVARSAAPDRAAARAASSGPVGPTTRIRCTTPGPTAAASRASSCRCSSRSWVAQAVDSACSTSSPSRSGSGGAVVGDVRADELGQRPSTVASVSRGDQPRSSDSREPVGRGAADRVVRARIRTTGAGDRGPRRRRRARPRPARPAAARRAGPPPPGPRAGPRGQGRRRARRRRRPESASCPQGWGQRGRAIGPGGRFVRAAGGRSAPSVTTGAGVIHSIHSCCPQAGEICGTHRPGSCEVRWLEPALTVNRATSRPCAARHRPPQR